MALTPEQLAQREGKLTASRIGVLMSGDESKILALWHELVGDPAYQAEDLSDVWAVQLGSHTESLNLDWYERRTGRKVTRRGDVIVHPIHKWAACTLDGWDDAPIECKHVGGYEKREVVLARYQPQLHWQMIVTGATRAIFSVIEGAKEPTIDQIEYDILYADELLSRAEAFWRCVETLTPPVVLPPVEPPVIPVREVDMAGNNLWGDHACEWLDRRFQAKQFTEADKALKGLVPADAKRAYGHGVEIVRDKANRMTVREMKGC